MGETNVNKQMLLQVGIECPETRLFRVNTAMAWQGTEVYRDTKTIILENPRPIHSGLVKGGSDNIGWTTVEITPDMIGRKVAIFTAIEAKVPKGKGLSEDQANFIQVVKRAGGIAGVARTPEEAVSVIKNK